MTIEVFADDDFRSDIADWAELSVLASAFHSISSSEVSRARAIAEDSEHGGDDYDGQIDEDVDMEIADLRAEARAVDVLAELNYRAAVLGDLYPFALEVDTAGWTLTKRTDLQSGSATAGRWTYIACLFATGLRTGMLLLEESKQAELAKMTPELLQILSVIAAAALINGEAFWMGWPREDRKQGMRSALEAFIKALGHGKLDKDDPDWSNGYERDGTVDVIAWRRFGDGRWASPILYGQVASGLNWRGKSVRTFLDSHFFEWFRHPPGGPTMTSLAALFMPFPLHRDSKPSGTKDFDTVALGKSRQDSKIYGIVVDRLRLAELVAERLRTRPHDDFVRRNAKGVVDSLRTWREAIAS